MKRLLPIPFLLLATTLAWASIGPMNYQGRLLDNAGVPVSGTYTFIVRIWDAPSGGTLKYAEQQNSVVVDDGVYSFLVSTGTVLQGSWDIALWNSAQLFLEISVNGETLSPRHRIAAAPYAYQANLALTTNNALALGGKTAEEYGTILSNICEAGKGKWLDNIDKCLGIGAVVTGEDAATMASDLDYTSLDLSRADVSNTSFVGANFSGTLFKDTTLTINGFASANLSGATLDGITSTGPLVGNAINFTNAIIKHVDLTGWNLASSNLTGLSAAYLTGCPATLPAGWLCRSQRAGYYFLIGPTANFSKNSAITIEKVDGTYIDANANAFDNLPDMPGMNFEGAIITQTFNNLGYPDFDGANFRYATLRDTTIKAILTNVDFSYATLANVDFWVSAGMSTTTFKGASLETVYFLGQAPYSGLSFDGTHLDNVYFDGGTGVGGITFSRSVIGDLAFDLDTTGITFDDCRFVGTLLVKKSNPTISAITGSRFTQATLDGNLANVNFSGNNFLASELKGNFYGADFNSNFVQRSVLSGNFHTATFPDYGNEGYNVEWRGATCPDGDNSNYQGNNCPEVLWN